MITPDEIRAVIEQPSELPATATVDDYLMEKFQRVAIEGFLEGLEAGCPGSAKCTNPQSINCRACWREALKREGK